nr:retrovirus-related Pol polyprotein from transposon TNT 1-94 [Tanacetum cinerariifolium]
MTSFGYRLNPRYAIKEYSSCGTLYTGDFCCSKGNVKDKILVPKLPKNCARCAKCGHPVNGPYCQGCTLLREKLEEDLVTYFQNFQNTFESSDDSTNVVNALREPFVVKKGHGVNPPHIDECCCECGNALDGIFCQQCTYSDHAGCLDLRKSTSGGIQFLGGDKLVSWSSKKQDCTSMSSEEVEYVSLSTCCAQVLWLRTQLTDYGFHIDKIPMYCDSKAAISISCNPGQHSRTKHIDVRYHFIKEKVEKCIVELFFVGTEYHLADLFTKALSEDRFKYLVKRLGMGCLTPEELEVLANKSA